MERAWIDSSDINLQSAFRNLKSAILLGALLFALCLPAEAQQPKKISRIGYLSQLDPAREFARSEEFRLALRELGHIEGQNIAIEYRYAEGNVDRFPVLAAELVRLKVNIVVIAGGRSRFGRPGMRPRPFLSLWWSGPIPSRRAWLKALPTPAVTSPALQALPESWVGSAWTCSKESVPKLARVAVFYDPAIPTSVLEVKEVLPVAARALKLTVQPWEIRGTDSFDRVFAALNKQRPDGLYLPAGGPLIRSNIGLIAGFALKSRLPSVYGNREAVEAGGLMAYGADFADSYRRVAYYVDRILKGAKPADLPVEQPTKFELAINLKTAKQIGLTIPQSVLYRADKVIK
jgi:putative ABC transport system substrate-binding protein